MAVEAKPRAWLICTPLEQNEYPPVGASVHTCDVCGADVLVFESFAEHLAGTGHELICAYCGWDQIGQWNGLRLERERERED